VARECEELDEVMKKICPVHGRPVHEANEDRASRSDQVNWAGLPVNLDFAFSRGQRDKVYVQHVMRSQGRRLWPWLHDEAQSCLCEGADHQRVGTDAAESVSSQ
jgi:sulfite reductase alpha subunit-like flavoprotein